ncbi:helix-turn-helix transcriptional regulator [Mucilaginibacter sp. ZT4R22]|uniref:Helix-turn-helix transcriptional regulator n=1 Tax=Mucilaginibacter pankratovii TaxID=2772110 RepID=A0ABR7WU88_9SPHI|nr:AraC family transcriptional regulator [Mucilaginibacter pankratovii]MBD1365874.1 helix-turn-helix transcriptional regulator [Mucilaginibacter pankratovii]
MIFEFTTAPGFDFITLFSKQINAPVRDNLLEIPKTLGEGYVRKVGFGDDFKLTIHRYILKEDLIVKRNPAAVANNVRTIFFYNDREDLEVKYHSKANMPGSQKNDSSILLSSNDLRTEIRFPAGSNIQYIVVGITANRLRSVLSIEKPNGTLKTITAENASFLFFESLDAEMQLLLKNIVSIDMNNSLNNFYVQIKVQELMYLLFSKLSLREHTTFKNINSNDAEKLLVIRNEVLSDLSTPPVLSELATMASMSETKLKQLFKQTFGDTIYNYYQKARMEEAAFLLKQAKHSVSEVGYELGFSNLSHFSRLFAKQYGITPKKFSYTS